MNRVRWGVLGVARIATTKVIPAMQQGEFAEFAAIASRDGAKAQEAARRFGIPRAYGSYEELLADPEIEAVYIPLPHNLHVPWSIRAAEAGKHVLCEKPIGLTVEETQQLIAARDRTGMLIGEAFMVVTHPQWLRIRELVRGGQIGQLRSVIGSFSYLNLDPANIRNVREYGGGGLLDIGCYPIMTSRMIFAEEPVAVSASIVGDARFGGSDALTSVILEFPSGHAIFTCSTQIAGQQSMRFYGTLGRIEPEIPFNAIPDQPSRIRIDHGTDPYGHGAIIEEFEPCNQYTIQGDLFSKAIREGGKPAVSLESALKNMAVIEAAFRSAQSGRREAVATPPQASGR